jgi:squalene-associated FAD-dependent desaturase
MVSLENLVRRKETMPSTIIVGAGWAGLKCAYSLSKAKHQVTLIDAAPQAGGRARAVAFGEHTVDNGQHICLGAYHTLRQLLRELGLQEKDFFQIRPMELFAHGKSTLHLKVRQLPTPFNLLAGLVTARNLPWRAKYQALRLCRLLNKIDFKLKEDVVLLDFLQSYYQSEHIIKHLWEPIALATMTTPINQASTQIFLNILKQVFNFAHNDSNWYFPATDLSSLVPQQIEQYLRIRGHQIIYGQSIKQLHITGKQCSKISSSTKDWQADHIVLAVPPWQAISLLQPHAELQTQVQALTNFDYEPISTIYFEFANDVQLPYPMVGMLGSTAQWVFDRAFSGQPKILSIVISGPGEHQKLSQEMLIKLVFSELKAVFKNIPMPIKHRVINEKRAAFSCTPAIQKHRPGAKTNIANLWLTGDYLQTNLPSTLEGALLSGKRTAAEILNERCDS